MSQQSGVGWGRTARGGAVVGAVAVGTYALLFLGYAVARATSTLLLTPDIDGGLARTIAATGLSLAVPVAVLAALCALPAALVGAATALIIRVLLVRMPAIQAPAALGGGVCAAAGLALLALLSGWLGIAWTRGTAEALTFWVALPLVIYALAGALGASHLQYTLAPAARPPQGRAR